MFFRFARLLMAFLVLAGVSNGAQAKEATYAEALDTAIRAMEQGRHDLAGPPLKAALLADRSEPTGLLALGTLYLHGGTPVRAAREFARARRFAPDDSLAAWGETLCTLASASGQGRNALAFDGSVLPDVPNAPLLAGYLRLLYGDPLAVRSQTEAVREDEPDALRLEIAGFAAFRTGDTDRAERLLSALVSRPGLQAMTEDRALVLLFLPGLPMQSGAPLLPSLLDLPSPPANDEPVSGRFTLTPPGELPPGTALVSYSISGGGGGYSASTNYAPFSSDWNTLRFPNGIYTLRTSAISGGGGVLKEWSRTFVLSNSNAPPSTALSSSQRESFRKRLLYLLTPRPSRKAAHFALAELATKRGDEKAALSHIEAVVAIDPQFQNAMQTLRRYNRATLGARAGVWKAITTEKLVALTFDDGPNPAKTPALLDALQAANVPATFFVVGLRAEASPDLLRRMDKEGHEIANHSYTHPNLTYLEPTQVERELCRTSVIVREATGKRPKWYRPPGGNYNGAVVDAAEALGMAGAYWTIDGVKYEQPPFTPAKLTQFVLSQLRPGAIILLHNAPDNTVAALPGIVAGLRARGYAMVTMTELIRHSQTGTLKPIIAARTGKMNTKHSE